MGNKKVVRTKTPTYSDLRDGVKKSYGQNINNQKNFDKLSHEVSQLAENFKKIKVSGGGLDSEILGELLDRLQNGGNTTTPLGDQTNYNIAESTNIPGVITTPQYVRFTGDLSLIKILYTINGENPTEYTSEGILINKPGLTRITVYSLPKDETDINKYKCCIKKDVTYTPSIYCTMIVSYNDETNSINLKLSHPNLMIDYQDPCQDHRSRHVF